MDDLAVSRLTLFVIICHCDLQFRIENTFFSKKMHSFLRCPGSWGSAQFVYCLNKAKHVYVWRTWLHLGPGCFLFAYNQTCIWPWTMNHEPRKRILQDYTVYHIMILYLKDHHFRSISEFLCKCHLVKKIVLLRRIFVKSEKFTIFKALWESLTSRFCFKNYNKILPIILSNSIY